MCACVLSHFSCVLLCAALWTVSPPGFSVYEILQARILEWIAMPSSMGSSWPRDQTCVSLCFLHWQVGSSPLAPPRKPIYLHIFKNIQAGSYSIHWFSICVFSLNMFPWGRKESDMTEQLKWTELNMLRTFFCFSYRHCAFLWMIIWLHGF